MNSFIVSFFVLVISAGSSYGQPVPPLGWNPTSLTLVEAGVPDATTFGVTLGFLPFDITCRFYDLSAVHSSLEVQISGATYVDVNPSPSFILGVPNQSRTLSFRAKNDGECEDYKLAIKIECGRNLDTLNRDIGPLSIFVQNTEPASVCKDPHLTQKVNGIDEDGKQVTKKICYDLFGKGGEQIELMSDNILGTSIVFQLRDDYYIGKAFISTKLGFFNSTTKAFSSPKSSIDGISWGKEEQFVIGDIENYPHAVVKQHKKDIVIEYKEKERSQTIKIVKIEQGIGKDYLNIIVEKSTTVNDVFDEFHGGIFGYIANQKYEFYNPVQHSSKGENKADLTVVRINGRFVKAFLRGDGSETDRCYSMSLDDLLYPKNVYSFQKSL